MYIINSSPTQNGLIKMGCAATGPAPADGRTTSERSQVQVLLLGPIRLLSRQTALRRRFKNHQLDRRRFVGAAFCLLIWWAQCAYLVGSMCLSGGSRCAGLLGYEGARCSCALVGWLDNRPYYWHELLHELLRHMLRHVWRLRVLWTNWATSFTDFRCCARRTTTDLC